MQLMNSEKSLGLGLGYGGQNGIAGINMLETPELNN